MGNAAARQHRCREGRSDHQFHLHEAILFLFCTFILRAMTHLKHICPYTGNSNISVFPATLKRWLSPVLQKVKSRGVVYEVVV